MSLITEVIIWVSPFLFAGFCWLANEVYSSFKEDISQLKTSNSNIRTDLAKQGVQITNIDSKVMAVCKSVEDVRKMAHELDKRTANVQDLNGTISKLSSRLDDSEQNYGKIFLILDGLARRTGINFKKSGS